MSRLSDLMSELEVREAKLLDRLHQLQSKEWEGKGEGLGVPCVTWRYGKYLILVYQVKGRRIERYIGSDLARVRLALQGVAVQKELAEVEKQLSELRSVRAAADYQETLITFQVKNVLQRAAKYTA